MAHQIESAMFVGKREDVWHGLGTYLENPPTTAEGIKAAGLDWEVKLKPLFTDLSETPAGQEPTPDYRKVTSHRAVVRTKDNSVLGVVGPNYHPLQNIDAFKWFDSFISSGLVELNAAASLRQGARIFVLAKIKSLETEILKGDPVEGYILLAHAHDGSLAIRGGFTNIRVVCNNTLTAALNDNTKATQLLRIKHTSRAALALEELKQVMDVATQEFNATQLQMQYLATMGCDENTMLRYVREVFAPGQADNEKAAPRIIERIKPLIDAGIGTDIPGVKGTWWGAFNALTEFVTHHQGNKNTTADGRMDSLYFGQGAQIITRGLRVAMEMAANEVRNVPVTVTINMAEEDESGEEIQPTGQPLPQDAKGILELAGNTISIIETTPTPEPEPEVNTNIDMHIEAVRDMEDPDERIEAKTPNSESDDEDDDLDGPFEREDDEDDDDGMFSQGSD